MCKWNQKMSEVATSRLRDNTFCSAAKISKNIVILYQRRTVKPVLRLRRPLSKRPKIGFQYQSSLNAGQMYCRMLQREHSAMLSNFIKLPFVIKIFVLSILSGRFTQVFTVMSYYQTFQERINKGAD